jgi:hypothetical protein
MHVRLNFEVKEKGNLLDCVSVPGKDRLCVRE